MREERAEELRKRILSAAGQVVGQYGYADASIGRITELAGIAQGTFYLYFESRQALFDVLLPSLGADMLGYIRKKVEGADDYLEVEERGFRAFFEYMRTNPGFFRILNEAEVAAPIAYAHHMQTVTTYYVRSLRRSVAAGEIRNFREDELETLAYIFQASRSYLYLRFSKTSGRPKKVPDAVVATYLKFVKGGLQ